MAWVKIVKISEIITVKCNFIIIIFFFFLILNVIFLCSKFFNIHVILENITSEQHLHSLGLLNDARRFCPKRNNTNIKNKQTKKLQGDQWRLGGWGRGGDFTLTLNISKTTNNKQSTKRQKFMLNQNNNSTM